MNEYLFRLGDTVVFDLDTVNTQHYTPEELRRYYGDLYNFDKNRPYMFTFITEHYPQGGHCMLMSMEHDNKIVTMVHTNNLRRLTDEEC